MELRSLVTKQSLGETTEKFREIGHACSRNSRSLQITGQTLSFTSSSKFYFHQDAVLIPGK